MPVGVAEKRHMCTAAAEEDVGWKHILGRGGEAVNTLSRRGREIDGKHTQRSGGEK